MIVTTFDDVLDNPDEYVDNIFSKGFQDIQDGDKVFKNIQPRDASDELATAILKHFPDFEINYNFIRMSPLNQEEPNFIHRDDMMGDVTCILYLNKVHPIDDGTTIYDEDENPVCKIYAKYNRMIMFDSNELHSRNIFENFGEGKLSRLVQVVFLKEKQ